MTEEGRFERIAKALADPRRFQILETIANCEEVGCQRLCEQFPVAQPTMSHHLKELVRAGLIETWREGQFVYYRFQSEVMRQYVADLVLRLGMMASAPTNGAASLSAASSGAQRGGGRSGLRRPASQPGPRTSQS